MIITEFSRFCNGKSPRPDRKRKGNGADDNPLRSFVEFPAFWGAKSFDMRGLIDEAGVFRSGAVGVADKKGNVLHVGTLPRCVSGGCRRSAFADARLRTAETSEYGKILLFVPEGSINAEPPRIFNSVKYFRYRFNVKYPRKRAYRVLTQGKTYRREGLTIQNRLK